MHFSSIFKHNKTEHKEGEHKEGEHKGEHKGEYECEHKDHKKEHHHHERDRVGANVPKGFANDAMRSSNKPDTLYGFDDPTARRLGPVPSEDPTNTGA